MYLVSLDVSCVLFNATAITGIYAYLHTLSLHDALPVYGAVHARRPGLRVLVAELRVVGVQVGTAVDLPGADRHAAVRAHVPGTREALPARQHRQPGADRVLRAAGHRVAVAALSHRDAAGRARGAGRRVVDRGGGHR